MTPPRLTGLLRYFLWLGTAGFGGPIALAGHMQRDLVDDRGWIAPDDYREGLAFAQLAPGPLAAQLAMYLGWVRARALGATLVALVFIGPSFLMVLALSALYVRFGGLPWMRSAFYGIGAAVIAIITRSALKLTRLTLARDRLLWALFGVSAAVTAWTEREIVWLFLACGAVALVARQPSTGGATEAGSAPAAAVAGFPLKAAAVGAVGAAVLGKIADVHGIEFVYRVCAYLPLIGLLTVFLPDLRKANVKS